MGIFASWLIECRVFMAAAMFACLESQSVLWASFVSIGHDCLLGWASCLQHQPVFDLFALQNPQTPFMWGWLCD